LKSDECGLVWKPLIGIIKVPRLRSIESLGAEIFAFKDGVFYSTPYTHAIIEDCTFLCKQWKSDRQALTRVYTFFAISFWDIIGKRIANITGISHPP
jgi:hypothetical protein